MVSKAAAVGLLGDCRSAQVVQIASEALTLFGAPYDVKREATALDVTERHRIRQALAVT